MCTHARTPARAHRQMHTVRYETRLLRLSTHARTHAHTHTHTHTRTQEAQTHTRARAHTHTHCDHFRSLNLSHAVSIVCYEVMPMLRQACTCTYACAHTH